MFAHHAINGFGGLHLTEWGSYVGIIIAHDVSIHGVKEARGISGISEYAKGNAVKGNFRRISMTLEETVIAVREYHNKCADKNLKNYTSNGIEIDPHTLAWTEYWLTRMLNKEKNRKHDLNDALSEEKTMSKWKLIWKLQL